ncbi:hypothetical protein [Actinacidiphila glaucinigra]|uniref:hypothetical protein n=1 Tax=Actinacidiphila glaucinigra TaxID=235986 RepID=UPI002E2F0E9B|nr:hypothetical protein [Actinacidiphila glaucinigra]
MAHRFQAGSGAAVLPACRGPMPWGRACAPHGLTGLRERAAALGGTLDAGPEPDGGFLVRATLPTDACR